MRGKIVNNTYTKIENEKQKLRLYGGSWTINLDEIEKKQIDIIIYNTQKGEYCISLEDALHFGKKMLFKGENKLVVPLKYWNKKVYDLVQPSLF